MVFGKVMTINYYYEGTMRAPCSVMMVVMMMMMVVVEHPLLV